jgi:hypothetical protein
MDQGQVLFNWLVGAASGLLGFIVKVLYDRLTDLQKTDTQLADKVQHIELLVTGQYIKRTELEKTIDALFLKLDRIEHKLDNKADKPHA